MIKVNVDDKMFQEMLLIQYPKSQLTVRKWFISKIILMVKITKYAIKIKDVLQNLFVREKETSDLVDEKYQYLRSQQSGGFDIFSNS